MPRYVYAGPGPVDDGEGGICRPGDIRDTEPDWGPWDELPDGQGTEHPADGTWSPAVSNSPERPAEAPAVPAPATERARPATASTAPPAAVPARTDPES